MNNLEIFKKNFGKGMINNDFKAFKRAFPTLLNVIITSMVEVSSEKLTHKQNLKNVKN
jgi:hypothetical protein